MRKSKDTGQEVWWSNFNAGLYEHYRQWYGVSRVGDLLPAEYIKHHPTTGWGRSYGKTQYMENAMELEMICVEENSPADCLRFGITIGDDSWLKAQRKVKGTAAQDLCMQMIQALDDYAALGHSGRILQMAQTTRSLSLNQKMREALTAEREQYRWPFFHGIHLKHLEPRPQRLKTAESQTDDFSRV
ncbi:hypothetical protein CNMCM7691_004292 [Aspergillus felis]|uniref:Uncharacterized protein n=1 Tax=Aspergillus felis TaxID=1287682 RepID=A0A8H6R280_9EURO|nr:hypothetical protein CNMCM7691_004292 [Aspergillus felis]